MSTDQKQVQDEVCVRSTRAQELSPEARRRMPNPQGFGAVLADGKTWVLAHANLAPELVAIGDEIYDLMMIRNRINVRDALFVAGLLLVANYDLDDEEVLQLLSLGGEPQEQAACAAVCDCLFGPTKLRRTYSAWALSALYSNGIEPSTIPKHLVPHVLQQLVLTKRAVPENLYVESTEAVGRRARLFKSMGR